MKNTKFYVCPHCGNLVEMVNDAGPKPDCCGQKMTELVPGTTDASTEKHVPVYSVEGNLVSVKVGSVEHPMLDVHSIQWIAVESKQGVQIKYLQPGQAPEAVFALAEGDELVAVYEYCNLHGLWKA